MDVVLAVGGEVVVDHQRDLLHVDTACQEVGGDEDAGGAGAELAHDQVALLLVHVSVHRGHGEVAPSHLLGEPVDLPARVAVDDRLRDGEGGVEVAERLQLPLLALDRDVELLDTLEGELVLLHEDAHRLSHELAGHIEDLERHRRGEDGALHCFGEELEHVVDLLLEAAGEHLVGLIQHEQLHGVQAEGSALDHVEHAAGRADHDVDSVLQGADVLPHRGAADACVDLHLHEVAQGAADLDDLLGELAGGGEDQRLALPQRGVQALQDPDREGGGLAGS